MIGYGGVVGSEYLTLTYLSAFLDYLSLWQTWMAGSQEIPAGVGDWNSWGQKAGGDNLCDPLEMGTVCKERPLKVFNYGAEDETGGLDLEGSRIR